MKPSQWTTRKTNKKRFINDYTVAILIILHEHGALIFHKYLSDLAEPELVYIKNNALRSDLAWRTIIALDILTNSELMSFGTVRSGTCCLFLKALSRPFAIHYLSPIYSGCGNVSWQLRWNKWLLTLASAVGSFLARAGQKWERCAASVRMQVHPPAVSC